MARAADIARPQPNPPVATVLGVADDLVNLIQESVIVCDLNGRISSWNRASERIYGWSRAEAEGEHLGKMLGSSQWPDAAQMEVLRLGQPIVRELRRKTAQGAEVIVCAQLLLRNDAAGRASDLIETAIDVTEQRRAESASAAEQRHYRSVFQAIPAAVWDIDFSKAQAIAKSWLAGDAAEPREWFTAHPGAARELMRLTYARDVNDQALALFGPCEREHLLVDIECYWPESSTADFAEWVISTLEGKSYFSCETRLRRYDGQEFPALFTANFAAGTVGEGRLVVSVIDYTDVKLSQAAARESEAFYTNMFHASAFSAWHMDARRAWAIFHDLYERGITDFRAHVDQNPGFIFQVMDGIRVVDVNDTTLRLFGARDRSDIIGGSIIPFWFPDKMEALLGSLEAAFNGIPTYRGLGRMRTLAGNEIDVLFTRSASTALSSQGQLLLAIVDITDKVRAQKALAEMHTNFAHAARVSSLGELTASIAHEVNQPLAAITANGEAALHWLERPIPDLNRIRSLANEMITDARRASDIVAHIRSMASPQASQQRRLSMSALVDDALTLMAGQLEKFQTVAIRELGKDLPDVLGDAVQLQQVVVNLVLNALQALSGASGARLLLRTYSVSEAIVLTVEDNGPGIPDDSMALLFATFFTTKADGMGIGLAICRTIVEAHGGTISAANLPAGGACFMVRLPIATDASVHILAL
jgi:PAS domain S-box-containing protein